MRGEIQEEEEMEGVQQWQQKKYFYGSKKGVKAAGGKKRSKDDASTEARSGLAGTGMRNRRKRQKTSLESAQISFF